MNILQKIKLKLTTLPGIILIFVIALVTAVFIVDPNLSYLKRLFNSSNGVEAIPKSTKVVSVIDVYSLAKKGELDELSELKFFKDFKKEVKNESKKLTNMMEEMMDDPSISGINFLSDVFVYYVNEGDKEQYMCMSAEISDDEKFSEFLEDFMKYSDVDIDIEDEDDYSYTLVGNEGAIGWDEDKVIFLGALNYDSRDNLEDEVETLLTLEDEDQISSVDEFTDFYDDKKDISLWVSSNIINDYDEFEFIAKQVDIDLNDNYMNMYLDFDDDNISLKTQFVLNEENQKLMEDNDVWNNDFNDELLNYFPKQNLISSSLSIDPMAYYTILKKEDSFKDINSEFKDEMGLDLKDIFESIKGNAVFSLFGMEEVEYSYMDWGYDFNEDMATLLDKKHPISSAGYLSSDDKKTLNQGKTIQTSAFNGKYCINIKNVLDNGGDIETAIQNDMDIIWYKDGWDYGPYIEKTKSEKIPLMGLAIDINNTKLVKKLIEKAEENVKIEKNKNYYEIVGDGESPVYFAYNDELLFITNDKKSIKAFNDGGYSSDNLKDSEISSSLANSNFYTHFNFDVEQYPTSIRNEISDMMDNNQEKVFDVWSDLLASMEIIQEDATSCEIRINTKNDDTNTLNQLITSLDKTYKYFLVLGPPPAESADPYNFLAPSAESANLDSTSTVVDTMDYSELADTYMDMYSDYDEEAIDEAAAEESADPYMDMYSDYE